MVPKSSLRYILVAPCIPLPKGGHTAYTYHAPKEFEISEGSVVKIPFGKRSIVGVVLQTDLKRPRYPTKPIGKPSGVVLTESQMKYAARIAQMAHGGLGFTLRLCIP